MVLKCLTLLKKDHVKVEIILPKQNKSISINEQSKLVEIPKIEVLPIKVFNQNEICKKCGSMMPEDFLKNNKGLCGTCSEWHPCFFCNSKWNVRMLKIRNYGLTWVCRWCKRKEDEEVV